MAIDHEEDIKDEKNPRPLDEDDIALLKTYGLGPYSTSIKKAEKEIKDMAKKGNDLCGIKESDTGLAATSQWDLVADKQMMQEEQPLQVARCTKIINPNSEDAKYVINVKQIAKFVVGLEEEGEEEEETHSKAKRIAWSDVEDLLLAQSWLNVSKDPIRGNDQKNISLWKRIISNYNNYREPSYPLRTLGKAKTHYQKMSKSVQEFVGCYKYVTSPPKSGHSEADNVDDALSLYVSLYKKKFKHVKVWRVLKDEPKWKGVAMATSSRRQKNSSNGTYTSSSNPSTPIDGSEYEAPQSSVRPPGLKAAKRKVKAKVATSPSNNDDLAAMEAVAKDRTKIMEDANLIRFPEILTRDTSQMTEAQLKAHNLICDKIMSKLA